MPQQRPNQIALTLPPWMLAEVDRIAEESGQTRAETIRQAISKMIGSAQKPAAREKGKGKK